MASTRFLRYLAPNVITLSSMIFGLVSLWASSQHDAPLAAWMVIYAVLTDRMDGIVARAVKGTSELGMQLDSFADFLNFGIAPAYWLLEYLNSRADLPYAAPGTYHTLLFVVCGGYMLCAVFRLARYNVLSDDQIPTKMFFGFPTTLTGGTLMIWALLMLKYDPHTPVAFGGSKLFGDDLHTPLAMWKYFPIAMAVGGYLMASRLPMPKAGMTRNKVAGYTLLVLITIGYGCGITMHFPEVCFWMPTLWSIVFLIWGQASAKARSMYPPPLFPKRSVESIAPAARPLTRDQEDLEDLVLDETAASGETPAASPSSDPDA